MAGITLLGQHGRMNRLAKELSVGRSVGTMTLSAPGVRHGIAAMGANKGGGFRIMAFPAKGVFFFPQQVALRRAMRRVTSTAALLNRTVKIRPLKRFSPVTLKAQLLLRLLKEPCVIGGVGIMASATFSPLHRPMDVGLLEAKVFLLVTFKADLLLFGKVEHQSANQAVSFVACITVVCGDRGMDEFFRKL